jgi:hypothetical protein
LIDGIVAICRNIVVPVVDIRFVWTIHSCDVIDNVQIRIYAVSGVTDIVHLVLDLIV